MKKIDEIMARYPCLKACREDIEAAAEILVKAAQSGGKILLCGNGGSAADCAHISGELLKGFLQKRPVREGELPELEEEIRSRLQRGIPAIPLPDLDAALTAFSNDVDASLSYAQLIFALGRKNDVFWGISTSGNALNVCAAAKTAKAIGMRTIGLCGQSGGTLAALCDCCIRVPEAETYRVQELHLPVYHALCAGCEEELFGGEENERENS